MRTSLSVIILRHQLELSFTIICFYLYIYIFYYYFIFRKKGTSLSLVTRDDWRQAHKLINIMVEANQVLI